MLRFVNRTFVYHAKGLFSPDLLTSMRHKIENLSVRLNDFKVSSEREKQAILRGESSDKLRMQDEWYDVWRKPAGTIEDLVEYFSPFGLVMFPVQVRNVRQVVHSVPWHQDIGYMRLLGERAHKQVITCFIPLEPNPAQCTTIQFSGDECAKDELVHHQTGDFGAGLNQDFQDVFHFDLSLGDALVFGDYALHRTFTPEGCLVHRRSLEFRLVQRDHMLDNKDYFDISKRMFIKNDGSERRAVNG